MERGSTQHSVSENESPPRPTNRTIEYLDSDSSDSSDFGPLVIVESRPNSGPENRAPLHTITQDAVLEHYVLTRAIDNWYGPKYETYKAKSSRLQTFVIHDWPHIMDLPPNDLSEAGFFFTGMIQYFSETFATIFVLHSSIPVFFKHRFARSDRLFPLRGKFKGLVTYRRCLERTRSLVSTLRLCEICQGSCLHSRMPSVTKQAKRGHGVCQRSHATG